MQISLGRQPQLVGAKGSFYCPKIFSQPGIRGWYVSAADASGINGGGLVHEAKSLIGENFDRQIFEREPRLVEAVDAVVHHVLTEGSEELKVGFHALSRSARLFHSHDSVLFPGAALNTIRLDLKSPPRIGDPQSLREFFLAVLATNPRYGGDVSAIPPNDDTRYVIVTPDGTHVRSIRRLIGVARARLDRDESPQEIFGHLVGIAGLASGDSPIEQTYIGSLGQTASERYFAVPRMRYEKNGLRIEYILAEPDPAEDVTCNGSNLSFSREGLIIVKPSALEGLNSREKALMVESAVLWQDGYGTFRDAAHATRMMLECLRNDGALPEFLDLVVTKFPSLFTTYIAPLENARSNGDLRSHSKGWSAAVAKFHARRFEYGRAVPERYRLGIRGNGYSGSLIQSRGTHKLMSEVMPGAFRRKIRSAFAEVRCRVIRMILEGYRPMEILDAVDDDVERVRDRISDLRFDIKEKYERALGATGFGGVQSLSVLKTIVNRAELEEILHFDSSVQRLFDRPSIARRMQRIANSPLTRMRKQFHALWGEARAFIEDEAMFSRLRYEFMSERLGWVPLVEVPAELRPLVAVAREGALEHHAGMLPIFAEGGKSLQNSPLRNLVARGSFEFRNRYTPMALKDDLAEHLGVRMGGSAYTPLGKIDVAAAYEHFIESRLQWRPMNDIEYQSHAMTRLMRRATLETFGGELPVNHPTRGKRLEMSRLRDLVIRGELLIDRNYTAFTFYDDVDSLLRVAYRDGKPYERESVPIGLNSAYRLFMEHVRRWKPTFKVPAQNRALLVMLRESALPAFGGIIPPVHPLRDERFSLRAANIFLREGVLPDSGHFRGELFRRTVESVLRLRRSGENYSERASLPEGYRSAYEAAVGGIHGWKPVEEVSAGYAPLVAMLRARYVWNDVPLQPPRLAAFIRDGAVRFNGHYRPIDFIRDAKGVLGLEMTGGAFSELDGVPHNVRSAIIGSITQSLGWCDMDALPEGRRALVEMVRLQVIDLFSGAMPEDHQLASPTFLSFIVEGDLNFTTYTPARFHDDLAALMRLRRDGDDLSTSDDDLGPEFDQAYQDFMADKLQWFPLHRVPRERRALVQMLRGITRIRFKGKLPHRCPKNMYRILAEGNVEFGSNYTTRDFRSDLIATFYPERSGGAIGTCGEMPEEFERAYEGFIAHKLQWRATGEMPEHRRWLVEMAREHALRVFGGNVRKRDTRTGLDISKSPVNDLISRGWITPGTQYGPLQLRRDLASLLFAYRYDGEGYIGDGEPPVGFDDALNAHIDADAEWSDPEDVPAHKRRVLTLFRDGLKRLCAGALPLDHPITGKNLSESPMRAFLISAVTSFNTNCTPSALHWDLQSILRMRQTEGGLEHRRRWNSQAFDDAYEEFIAPELKWRSTDEVPRENRELLALVRGRMVALFGGKFIKSNPVDGRNITRGPLARFVVTGEIRFNHRYSMDDFVADVRRYLLDIQLGGGMKPGYRKRRARQRELELLERYRSQNG